MRSKSFQRLVEIFEQLRGERGCPWDKEQTRESIQSYMVEEVYEVLEAIDKADPNQLREELGDLLLQIMFHSQIAKELGEFDAEDVLATCIDKIIRRHPHVFGDETVKDSREVLSKWEDLKSRERGPDSKATLLDGLPKALPALVRAQRVQERVSRVGFDWPSDAKSASPEKDAVREVLSKVEEELREMREALQQNDKVRIQEEFGDLLFSLVNLGRMLRIDPESALRGTTARFIDRFKEMDKRARAQGRSLDQMSLEEMNILWEQAKGR